MSGHSCFEKQIQTEVFLEGNVFSTTHVQSYIVQLQDKGYQMKDIS
jgi:hypothetical protein